MVLTTRQKHQRRPLTRNLTLGKICKTLLVASCRYPVFVLLIGRFFMTLNHSVKDFPRSHRLVTPAGIVATGCLLLLRCLCRSDYHWRELPHVSLLSRLRQNTFFVATKTKTRLLSRQKYVFHDKHVFVATKLVSRQK